MFYFLADHDRVILKLCAYVKIVETFFFFFCTFSTIKIRKRSKNQQIKKRIFLQVYKNLLGHILSGLKKDISWKHMTNRSPVMNNVCLFVLLKADANTVHIIISAEQIMRHLQFLEIYSWHTSINMVLT